MSCFEPDHFYHIYNRGNNKQNIFFTDANLCLLPKEDKKGDFSSMRHLLLPYAEPLSFND